MLFVADEVLSGYGRCGSPFAAGEWDVEPDIITLGKAIVEEANEPIPVAEAVANGLGLGFLPNA